MLKKRSMDINLGFMILPIIFLSWIQSFLRRKVIILLMVLQMLEMIFHHWNLYLVTETFF